MATLSPIVVTGTRPKVVPIRRRAPPRRRIIRRRKAPAKQPTRRLPSRKQPPQPTRTAPKIKFPISPLTTVKFLGRRNPLGLMADLSLTGMQLLTEYFPPGRAPPKPELTEAKVFLNKVREPSLQNPLLDPVIVTGFAPRPAAPSVPKFRTRATPQTIIRRPQSIGELIQQQAAPRSAPTPSTRQPLTQPKTVVKRSATIGKLEPLAGLGPIPQEALQRKDRCPPPRKRRKCERGEFKRRCTNWEKVPCP